MGVIEDQIAEIEDEIRRTQKNKATNAHIGRLKAKIALLRIAREKAGKGGGGGGLGYAVRKSGHATVALVGYPSVGKSTLLTHLTGAESAAAAYEFTTTTIIPGMLSWRGAAVQILDMPGLIPGASKGRGRGREVISVARGADLIFFLLDKDHLEFRSLLAELEQAGIRVNGRPPKIVVTALERGGVEVHSTVKLTKIDIETAQGIAKEFRVHNGSIVFRQDATPDELIDVLAGNRVYIPGILVMNKADLIPASERPAIVARLSPWKPVFVSAQKESGFLELKEAMSEALAFIRVYVKPPGQPPDMAEPVILRKGDSVDSLLKRLPPELGLSFKSALVWGKSARFPGQTVGREHSLADQDIVTVTIQRGA
ncbi:MAG: GTP-binding protein [Euryarchaeota archaeon]|nr:GTP-binding protein [Euryarchaeota archaeon]MDE2044369.1 GTP-binding protein [Thermoplasmata archaeon]